MAQFLLPLALNNGETKREEQDGAERSRHWGLIQKPEREADTGQISQIKTKREGIK